MYLAPELFLIPDADTEACILYAPLLGVAAHVNAEFARVVTELKSAPAGGVHISDPEIESQLRSLGLVSSEPYPKLEPDSRSEAYVPTSVSLFLTTSCNLGCTYCYASANENPKSLSWPIAKRALDLIVENARRERRSEIAVTLHGGGEATLEWELLGQIVKHTREAAAQNGLRSRISIGTNGVMPAPRASWLAENLDSATVSLDGNREIHDRNRPTAGGGPSYDIVLRTLGIFDARGFSYGLRVTVTRDWVSFLPETILDICRATKVSVIQVEPVFPVGRALENQLLAPEARLFIEAFRRAEKLAFEQGRHLTYSGARLGTLSDRFCAAAGRSFAVTPTGEVSSCYEVAEADDARAPAFFWGKYEAEREDFVFDAARREAQTAMTVHGKPGCAGCFCKWHCAGDCSAKLAALGDPRDTTRNPRCQVNRALTRDQLVRAIRNGTTLPLDEAAPSPQTEGNQA